MGEAINLSGNEAVKKLKELADGKMCMFCTHDGKQIVSRPMSTSQVEDDGTIWFFSNKESLKNMQLKEDNQIYLMYADTAKQHYLSLTGIANILIDKNKIDELWNPIIKAWFEEGKDDPDITLIKVQPENAHYWDTKNGKLISNIKIAVAALTGYSMDGSVEGDLKI
ncbi:MAG: pyridoxamine 5'-phosphate oxidase family protein [Chitinophagaceae bacterium]|nr:pyridoxamine 5'-phosphate oxidase family protein [Chitinophagaceae bacterium]